MKTRRETVIDLARTHGAVARPVAASPRKRIGIRELLTWAFCEELPKDRDTVRDGVLKALSGGEGAWGAITRQGALMVETVSASSVSLNAWGIVPDFSAITEPHPDALAVGRAVQALDDFVMAIPPGWAADVGLRGDVGGLSELEWQAAAHRALGRVSHVDAEGLNVLRVRISDIVVHAATTRQPPRWQAEPIARRVVMQANHSPAWFVRVLVEAGTHADGSPRFAEVERAGSDRRGKPLPGAYQKTVLEPDPSELLVRRAEYELWHAALDVLAEELTGLEGWIVQGHWMSPRPWLAVDNGPRQRVLPDMTPRREASRREASARAALPWRLEMERRRKY